MPRTRDPELKGRLDALKANAKIAITNVVEALNIAAELTENVPYLGAISKALSALLKIYEEVEALKSEWKAVATSTRRIKLIIDKVHDKCESRKINMPEGMVEPLGELQRTVVQTLETLDQCRVESKRKRDRVKLWLGRGDLLSNVKECQAGMKSALDAFMVELQIDQSFNLDAMMAILDETRPNASEPTSAIVGADSLPAKPAIFYGREQEAGHIVDMLVNKAPARIAIMGLGGIGKTSIALTALHHPNVEAQYGERRFFLSCEAVLSADGIVQELVKMFGVIFEQGRTPQSALLAHLRTFSDALLCLDNLETPWDADTLAVETLLALIAAVPRFALMVTTRGADRPFQVAWSRPFLPQITPLTVAAALDTWDAICDSHDEYVARLVEAVDFVPLAVTLLARLAQSESPKILWLRWEQELTELVRVRGPEDRLSSVDVSIKLSLDGPRLQNDKATVQLLSVLCTLPQGMLLSCVPIFAIAYTEHIPDMYHSLALLKQCALAFEIGDGFLRVLSPVRHYMQTHYPITSTPLFFCLAKIYRDLVRHRDNDNSDWVAQRAYARSAIQPELANTLVVLQLCLTCMKNDHRKNVDCLFSLSTMCKVLERYDEAERVLSSVVTLYGEIGDLPKKARSLASLGEVCTRLHRLDKAEQVLLSAKTAYEEAGDRPGMAFGLLALGELYESLNRWNEAEQALLSAQTCYEELGNRSWKAHSLQSLGILYTRTNRLEKAEQSLLSAHNLYEEMDDRLGKANNLNALGDLYMKLARHDEAERAFLSAQALNEEIGSQVGKVNSLQGLGELYIQLNQLDEAERALLSAQAFCDEIGERKGKANSLLSLGDLYMQLNRLDEAERALSSAQSLYDEIGNRLGKGKANTLISLGDLRRRLRQYDDALELLEAGKQLSRDISYPWGQEEAQRQIELVHEERAGLAGQSS